MLSAFSLPSAFSSSLKASPSILWILSTAIHSFIVTLAINPPGVQVSTRTVKATTTVPVVFIASPCTPIQGTLSRPCFAAFSYFGIVCIIVILISYWKGYWFPSPSNDPPNPNPDPAPATISSGPQDSPFFPDRNTAAAGPPPPPPPGDDTTSGSKRWPKRPFGMFAWLLRIIAWISLQVVRLFRFIFLKAVFAPVMILSSILFRYTVLPAVVFNASNHYGVTPIIASSTGPYIFWIIKSAIDSSTTLWWLTMGGLVLFTSGVIKSILWVFALIWTTLAGTVRFVWRLCRSICLRVIGSIQTCIRAVRALPHRIKIFSKRILTWWRVYVNLYADEPAKGCVLLACLLVIAVIIVLEVSDRVCSFIPAALDFILWCRHQALVIGFIGRALLLDLPPIFLLLVCESDTCQTVVFWWDWLILPTYKLIPEEDIMIIVGVAFFWRMLRWLFSNKRTERAARARLERRIEALEARLHAVGG
ncbi:hypothetical protein MVEN_00386700 [Mycena venus]|uniref:Transmembrane protein n=1 Tax=Mycena venus TaxID=2733690 RepID=A0A8H6YUJ8_9AGAR|nr:hypothetical protein MVEN_00386700 [Mycena venus]